MTTQYPTTFDSDDEIIRAANAIIAERWLAKKRDTKRVFNAPAVAQEFFTLRLHGLQHEEFHIAILDNRHRLLSDETRVFNGTIDACSVYPRIVLKRVMDLNGAAVILAHNHPSGVLEPSRSDLMITERLKDTLGLVDVRILDHIIVGDGTYSFAEHGEI